MKKAIWTALTVGLISPIYVFAQASDPCVNPIYNPLDPGCASDKFKNISGWIQLLFGLLTILRTIFWILAVGMIFYAAYLYLFGGAGEKNVGKAKTVIGAAVVAMIIALLATAIPWLVASFLQS